MPSGYHVTEAERQLVLRLNAARDQHGDRAHTFAEIGDHIGICERSVALIVRDYAAVAWRWETEQKRLDRYA